LIGSSNSRQREIIKEKKALSKYFEQIENILVVRNVIITF